MSTSGEYIADAGLFSRECEEGLREPQLFFSFWHFCILWFIF